MASHRLILACAVVLLGCAVDPIPLETDGGVPLEVVSVEDLGALPLPSEVAVGRDGASSGVIGGRLLWTFGDTFVTTPTSLDGSHVVTATGGWATVAEPLALEHAIDADGVPAQLVPYTDDELAENRADALNGWALWPCGVIDTGAAEALVLFQRIERIEGSGFEGRGLATARIAPGAAVAGSRSAGDLFTRPTTDGGPGTPLYGVGGTAVIDEVAYLFACESLGGCTLARAPRARADQRDAYEFFDGTGWSDDASRAAVVLRNVGPALSLSYNPHLGRYLAVHSRLGTDDVVLRTAARPEGPWPGTGLTVPARDGEIVAAGEGTNYLAQEHAALRSEDGTQIVISYSRPLGAFRGEVRLARITLR